MELGTAAGAEMSGGGKKAGFHECSVLGVKVCVVGRLICAAASSAILIHEESSMHGDPATMLHAAVDPTGKHGGMPFEAVRQSFMTCRLLADA